MSNNNTANISSIVSKVWAFCNTLRDDGVGYGDYLEQLTYSMLQKINVIISICVPGISLRISLFLFSHKV